MSNVNNVYKEELIKNLSIGVNEMDPEYPFVLEKLLKDKIINLSNLILKV